MDGSRAVAAGLAPSAVPPGAAALLAALESAPWSPPDTGPADPAAVRELHRRGLAVEVGPLWFATSAVSEAAAIVARLLADSPDGMTVGAVRDALGASRKHVVPLLEHFDATGVTRRRGDLRIGGPRLPQARLDPGRAARAAGRRSRPGAVGPRAPRRRGPASTGGLHDRAEGVRIGQQPGVVPLDHHSRGADRRAQGVEAGPGDDLVPPRPQGDDRQLAGLEILQLGGEVGLARQLGGLPHGPRIAEGVGQGVLQEHRQDPGELGQRQHVAGKVQAPVPQRPLRHRAHPAPGHAPRGSPHGVDQHQLPHPLGEPVGHGDGHPAAERMTDDEGRAVDPHRVHEGVDPLGVPGEGGLAPRQVGGAAEAGQGRRPHPTAHGHQAAKGPAVGVLREAPAVEEHHGKAGARHAIGSAPPVDTGPFPDQVIDPFGRRGQRHRRSTVPAPPCVRGAWLRRRPTPAPAPGQPARRARTAFRSISFRPPQMPCGSRICSA